MSTSTRFDEELAKSIEWLARERSVEFREHQQSYLALLTQYDSAKLPDVLKQHFWDFIDSSHAHINVTVAEMRLYSQHFNAIVDHYAAHPEQRAVYKDLFAAIGKIDQHYRHYSVMGCAFRNLKTTLEEVLQTEKIDNFLQQHQSQIPSLTQQQLAQLMGKVALEPALLAITQRRWNSKGESLDAMATEHISDLLYWGIQLLVMIHYKNLPDSLRSDTTQLQSHLLAPLYEAIMAEHPAILEDRNFKILVGDFESLILLVRSRKVFQLLAKYTTQKAKNKQLDAQLQALLMQLNFTQYSLYGMLPGKQLEKYQQKIRDTVQAYQMSEKASQSEHSQENFDLNHYQLPWSNSVATVGAFVRQDTGTVAWSAILQQEFEQLEASDKQAWLLFWQHVEQGQSAKPTKKWLTAAEKIWQQPQISGHYLTQLRHWWQLIEKKSDRDTRPLDSKNETVLRAVLWFSQFEQQRSDELLQLLSQIAQYCYRKIFGVGAASAVIGGVALNLLSQRGLVGLAKLSFLQRKVRYELGQKIIRKALNQAAQENHLSVDEIREVVAEDFDFVTGQGELVGCMGYDLQLRCVGDHRCEVVVLDTARSPICPVPKAVEKYSQYKSLKQTAAQVSKSLAVHRQNFEEALCHERSWNYAFWQQYILGHGLLGWMAGNLIWQLTLQDGTQHVAMYQQGAWRDAQHQEYALTDQQIVSLQLWHPVLASTEAVLAWRQYLIEQKIVQAFKQAFREIYLVSNAEQGEKNSLRFAYHYLQQSKFKAIANARGWGYDIQGGWDNFSFPGRYFASHDIAVTLEIALPEHNQLINEHGVYAYIKTQQLHFRQANVQLDLDQVPALVFSEALRDIDYFVQGCSIGLDPNLDLHHFPEEMQQYYLQRYHPRPSQVIASRQQSLDMILSKLAIAPQCQIDNNFVYVQGQLHRYKIHLATAHVFIESDLQSVWLVPQKKLDQISVEHLFLPFDDDAMLSLILSKILLLARDDQIQDQLIQSQIRVA